ncbi:hypothetical protein KP509_22G059800 [Ceratopteris richardii]|uniref:Nuclear pore complex protein NUP88 n=1 Tax=Ceratopteris richardii TaxID=49495 RepID=A0A8T2S8Z1_CERRI|nr:hypothetical protein KP509_22G059800 [Ceratopteris richardii]
MAQLLSKHPVFKKLAHDSSSRPPTSVEGGPTKTWRISLNLLAFDGSSRIFVWNSVERVLHALEIEQNTAVENSDSLFVKENFKTFQLLPEVDFSVRFITFNRAGWSLLIAGDHRVAVVDITSQISRPAVFPGTSIYDVRASTIGLDIFQSSSRAIRILQVAWHPYSDTHIGILSSDGVFRLFDLSCNLDHAEQEYHLQSQFLERSVPATYARPVAFSFGGGHLWDRFAVFLLYSNGSTYCMCPVSPFGSFHNVLAIEELYQDACQCASSANVEPKSSACAGFAAAWLESVFPTLTMESLPTKTMLLKAAAHVPFNASLQLQGPLPVIMGADVPNDGSRSKGRGSASMMMYSNAGKDSILAVSFWDGEMHLYALADELQPMWNDTIPPRLQINSEGLLEGLGMLVERCSSDPLLTEDVEKDEGFVGNLDGVWTGEPPPLLQLAVIDFALPSRVLESAPLSILGDQVVPERLYCHHAAGIDAILLQWLPFSEQSISRTSTGKPPTVYPILDTCPVGKSVNSPLLGITQVLNGFGEVWLVAVTASCECAVIGVKSFLALDPLSIDVTQDAEEEAKIDEGGVSQGVLQVISKELLRGPKDIPIPQVSFSGKLLTVDSIEGKEVLHDHWKLLHEKYIEYVHRVDVELNIHVSRLQQDVQDQQQRLSEAQSKLVRAVQFSSLLVSRIAEAGEKNKMLKEQVRNHRAIFANKQMPLTATEREYLYQLDVMRLHDLDILHSAVDILKDRFERQLQCVQSKGLTKTSTLERPIVPTMQMNKLKATVDELAQMVENNLKQIRRVEAEVEKREQIDSALYVQFTH